MYFKTNKELTLAEFGVIATMIGLPSADYVTVDELAQLSADNIEVTSDILDSLIAKDYVLKLEDKYAVNKEIIPVLANADRKVGDL